MQEKPARRNFNNIIKFIRNKPDEHEPETETVNHKLIDSERKLRDRVWLAIDQTSTFFIDGGDPFFKAQALAHIMPLLKWNRHHPLEDLLALSNKELGQTLADIISDRKAADEQKGVSSPEEASKRRLLMSLHGYALQVAKNLELLPD